TDIPEELADHSEPRPQACERRAQVLHEQLRVLGHREMADAAHHLELCARYLRRGGARYFRGAGKVVLAGEHDDRTFFRVDAPDALARIPFAAVKADVAPEHPVAAVRVFPPHLARALGRALRRHQAVHPFRDKRGFVDLRISRQRYFAPDDALARFACDHAAEALAP